MTRVAVVGAGVAGVAAAFAAKKAGASVVVYHGRAGASDLTSGAVDGDIDEGMLDFIGALGVWVVSRPRRVVSRSGIVRRATSADASVLDVSTVRTVGVAKFERLGWDADDVARAASCDEQRFVPVSLPFAKHDDERSLPDADLARRHDDPARVRWLVERIRDARRRDDFDALLVGPWLGIDADVAATVSADVGIPVGETLSMSGGPAGIRLRNALDRLLREVATVVAREVVVGTRDGVTIDDEPFDAAVLACGGLVGGGLVYRAPDPRDMGAAPPRVIAPCFPDAEVAWTAVGSSSALPPLAWTRESGSVLERVGIAVDGARALVHRKALDRVLVAGDARAMRPRTITEAIRSGLAAGAAAAGVISSAPPPP